MEKLSVLIDRLTQVLKDNGDIGVLTVNEDGLYSTDRDLDIRLAEGLSINTELGEKTILFINV